MKCYLIFILFLTTNAFANNKLLNTQEILEIKKKVAPFANGYLAGAFDNYCPYTVSPSQLELNTEETSEKQVVFNFKFGSKFKYCNDGAPDQCKVSVHILRDDNWDTDWPSVSCK